MKAILKVNNLSKQYRVRGLSSVNPTLREALVNAFKNPLSRLDGDKANQGEILRVLEDVSFVVEPGEVIGIIGRNGAGKSTLLRILCRITKPTSREADIYSRAGSLPAIRTRLQPALA